MGSLAFPPEIGQRAVPTPSRWPILVQAYAIIMDIKNGLAYLNEQEVRVSGYLNPTPVSDISAKQLVAQIKNNTYNFFDLDLHPKYSVANFGEHVAALEADKQIILNMVAELAVYEATQHHPHI